MKLCVKETAREDRIERVISDETVMVVSSPMMLRRKKKGTHPLLKGLIRLQDYPLDLYEKFLDLEDMYGYYFDTLSDCDFKEYERRISIRRKIDEQPSYWFLFDSRRGTKDCVFDFLFKTSSHDGIVGNMQRKFKEDYVDKRNWGVLQYGAAIPILRKYRIINKLLDEMIIVRLSE